MRNSLIVSATLFASALSAQEPGSAGPAKIQDNSFLVEEAYNQEAGVVQHIGTFQIQRGSNDFDFVFTQEWPVKSVLHQLSYDVPLVRVGSRRGVGDLGINYRHQLLGDGNARLAVSPRASVILPTGDWKLSRGRGAVGFEAAIPVSFVISPLLTSHSNIGAGYTPSARSANGDRAGLFEWSAGQSLIVTASPFIQPMVEAVYSRGREVVAGGSTRGVDGFVISPGVRAAFNFASGLQIVPGVAIPIGIGPNNGERGVFVYLSFEHPFIH